ncbi:glycosyl hydrolase family 71 [Colletotrichum graminicola]|nr:glycosyl hydrolase family 71 [Colletotrichum graminicola]
MNFTLLVGLLGLLGVARCQSVFAHFMITNSANYSANDWLDDISAAQKAHIDAFALNMAYGDATNERSVTAAFEHASRLGFRLFFSFDYAGNGPWPKNDVESFINRYAGSGAYFHYQGKPFVSTFEGPDQAEDWIDIKAATGCFFIPDWSSLGAKPAMAKAGGVADGLFSWAAWPWGDQNMDTYVDASYQEYLGGKPYMMPVSPWFYTNLPGYNKNWMWRGDDLWFDRWQQILWWRPEFVEIISWNDYGESHHIGPVRDMALEAFAIGKAPFNYVLPHDGWRETLPFSIDMYKYNTTTFDSERLVVWYRPNPSTSCNSGGTSGNTASQLQLEFHPWNVTKDAVYFTALLASPATIEVVVGGVTQEASWSTTPEGDVGLYHGNAWYYGSTGDVRVRVVRGGSVVAEVAGIPITNDCSKTNGYTNWNAWVGSAVSSHAVSAKPNSRADQVCVEGTGPLPGFARLCEFTCGYGYCPQGACHCTKLGAQVKRPTWKGVDAFPAAGRTSDYQGLCQNACNWGFCPSTYCDTTQHPTVIATVSQFLPEACIRGEAMGTESYFNDLCSFSCAHGFCPIAVCYCSAQGALDVLEPTSSSDARTVDGAPEDHGLCAFACARENCPGYCA